MIEQHLAQAERPVLDSQGHVDRQREIVSELEDDGRDLVQARKLLATFETTHAMHVVGPRPSSADAPAA